MSTFVNAIQTDMTTMTSGNLANFKQTAK